MSYLLDLLYALAVCVGWPFLVWRRFRRGPGSLALGERLGRVPSRPVSARCVWLHGVSVGEVNATRSIVDEIRRRAPDTVIVFSSTSNTGLARARQLYPDHTVFRFPLDFSFVIRRVLTRLRPSAIVLMELEVWPNLVEVARAADIPVIIANGRITEHGSMRYFRLPLVSRLAARMFGRLDWIGAQEPAYRDRFVALGARPERVAVVGSVKYDGAVIADHVAGQDELAADMAIDPQRPLIVAGSTGPREEPVLLGVYRRLLDAGHDPQLALVPRKPERFEAVADLVVAHGFTCLRRSGAAPRVPPEVSEPVAVQLGDTMGELRTFYALADIVFVGRTLVPMGGSDVMEAAGLARPVLVGPHCDNFAEPVERIGAAGGLLTVRSADELYTALDELLRDAARRRRMGQAARAAVVAGRGASARTVARLFELIDG